ncbi:MAG: hypothetical protein JWM98_1415 [Thermoleophilia bacterium]|nr:hypothetical protein [Thermoleophilia bacterium]
MPRGRQAALDGTLVATLGTMGGAAVALPVLYAKHANAFAPMSTLARSAVMPAILGGAAGAAAAGAIAAYQPEQVAPTLIGAVAGAALGALAMLPGARANLGVAASPARILAGPMLKGAGMHAVTGAALGYLAGVGLHHQKPD